jgi:Domain of unknown function (DUF6457)
MLTQLTHGRTAHDRGGGAMTRDEWIAAYARELGVAALSVEESEALLELAAISAHASERAAAPLTCFLAGRSGRSLAALRDAAERLAKG